MSSIYLITGPSGAGKTTVAHRLEELGYQTLDADSTPGLAFFVNKNNKPVPYPADADTKWWENHNYIWELDRLKLMLGKLDSSKPIFVCGNAGNIRSGWDIFSAVYLDIPSDQMSSRIDSAKKDDSFGQRVQEREQLVRWAEPFKALMLELGAVTIDATRPVETVTDEIIAKTKALSA